MTSFLASGLALLVCSSCVALPDDDEGSNGVVTQDVDTSNGKSLNGKSLNGTSLNGKSLNGKSLNGTSLNGKSLNGTSLNAAGAPAQPLTGASVVGSTWTGLVDSDTVPLRIDAAMQGTGANADLWFYRISYQSSTGWAPICGTDASNAPIYALSLQGMFNTTATWVSSSSQFMFACRGMTTAKCVELGYKPWKGLSPQLQTCTRLLRADYCGTGVSHTSDGTLINVFDNAGVQSDTEAWTPEGEWSATGALCLRNRTGSRYFIDLTKEPGCKTPPVSATCGSAFHTGALLIDELSPSALTAIQNGQL